MGNKLHFSLPPSRINNEHEYKASISLNTFWFLLLKQITRNRTVTQEDNLVLLHFKLYFGLFFFYEIRAVK
jgi:hypothetical protein